MLTLHYQGVSYADMVLHSKKTPIFNIIFVVNVGMMREKTEKEILFQLMGPN